MKHLKSILLVGLLLCVPFMLMAQGEETTIFGINSETLFGAIAMVLSLVVTYLKSREPLAKKYEAVKRKGDVIQEAALQYSEAMKRKQDEITNAISEINAILEDDHISPDEVKRYMASIKSLTNFGYFKVNNQKALTE